MSSTMVKKQPVKVSRFAVFLPLFFIFTILAVLPQPAHAWKLKTHVYVANLIMADALDNGKVWIPPFGEFAVDPVALNAMRNHPDSFRAGAIGPDGFPDMFTGQMKIHTATDPWLIHLWRSAEKYAAGEVNASPLYDGDDDTRNALGQRDASQAWAFVYGYLTHCGGDMWAHDWVNYYSGGVFPGLNEIKANPQVELMKVARHLAAEGCLDKKVMTANRRIALPKDFVFRYMVQDKQAKVVGMNPVTEYFHDKYWQKFPHRGNTTWDGEWFYDLELGLVKWVSANETAIKQAVEPDQPKSLPKALADNLGPWAAIHVLDMLGLPSISRYIGSALVDYNNAVDQFWNMVGLSEEARDNLTINWSDALCRVATGMGEKEWEAKLSADTPDPMFFPNAQHRQEIVQEIGNIPAESQWVHSNTDKVRFQQFVQNICGPLYNSVITGKIAVISKSEMARLDPFVARTRAINPLIGQLRAIDYSRQWKGFLDTGISGYEWEPQRYGAFHYVFKPYLPIDRSANRLWCEMYTQQPTEVAWSTKFPGRISATMNCPAGVDMSGMRLCVRKANDTTSPWSILQGKSEFSMVFLQNLGATGEAYLVRPMHSRLNFDNTRVQFAPPVDLFQNLSLQPLGTAPANLPITSDGQSDPMLNASADESDRNLAQIRSQRPHKSGPNVTSRPGTGKSDKSDSLLMGPMGVSYDKVKNPYGSAYWQKIDKNKLVKADQAISIPVLDQNGRPTGQTVTITPGTGSASVTQTGFKITGEIDPGNTNLAVQGNTFGMPSETPVEIVYCYIVKDNKAFPLAGCSGKLTVIGGDDCITPSRPVETDFLVEWNGSALFGARSLVDVYNKTTPGSYSTTLKVGSHPGFIKLKGTLNVSPACADIGRMCYAYKQVSWMINQVYPNTGRAAEWQPVQQVLREVYKNTADPANGEKVLKDAIVAVNDTTYNKNYVLKALDDAIAAYPAKTGPGSECWRPQSFEAVFMVQPNMSGPDSDSIPPSFTIGPAANTGTTAGNTGNTGSNTGVNPTQADPTIPKVVAPVKIKTPGMGR